MTTGPQITAGEAAARVRSSDNLLVAGVGITGSPVHLPQTLAVMSTRDLTKTANILGGAGVMSKGDSGLHQPGLRLRLHQQNSPPANSHGNSGSFLRISRKKPRAGLGRGPSLATGATTRCSSTTPGQNRTMLPGGFAARCGSRQLRGKLFLRPNPANPHYQELT